MSFDTEVKKILRREGGYSNDPDDRGGETRFGISSKANPDVDVKNLTEAGAIELYRKRYWEAADVSSFPVEMQGAVFDAAVQHGAATAKRMAREAGGDMAKFNAARSAIYAELIRTDPKQKKFARGWANRLAEFGAKAVDVNQIGMRGSVSAPLDPDTAWTTAGYTIENRVADERAAGGSRQVRNPLAEASVRYLASLTAATGADTAPVFQKFSDHDMRAAGVVADSAARTEVGSAMTPEYEAAVAAQQEQDNIRQQFASLGEKWKVSLYENSLTAQFLDDSYGRSLQQADIYGTGTAPTRGLRYVDHMSKWEEGRTEREIEELRDIGSRPFSEVEIDAAIIRQNAARRNSQKMAGTGVAGQIGMGLVTGTAGDPLGMLGGYGVYKGFAALGIGARSALQAGNTSRAFLYGGLEGSAGNLAVTAAMDAMGHQQSAGDYALSAAFGLGIGLPATAFDIPGVRAESVAAAQEELRRIIKSGETAGAERVAHFNQMARDELGAGASEPEIAARGSQLEADATRTDAMRNMGERPDTDMLLPRAVDDEVEQTADAALGDFTRNRDANGAWSESRELRDGLTDAEISGNAVDALRAVVRDSGASTPMRALASRISGLVERLDVGYVPHSDLTGEPAKWNGAYFRDTNTMSVRTATAPVIVHEAVHGATSNLIAMPKASMSPKLRAKVERLDDLRLHVNKVANGLGDSVPEEVRGLLSNKLGPSWNTQEFVTYAMTNEKFQKFLATVPAPQGTAFSDAWDWFKDLVRDLLGLRPGDRSALDEAIEATGDLLDFAESDVPRTKALIDAESARLQARTADAAMPDSDTFMPASLAPGAILRSRAEVNAVASRYGLDASISDNVERAIAAEMYARAERMLANVNIDKEKLRPLLSKVGWEASSTRMLLSENPLMRATGMLLSENPEGAAGRRYTAALDKHMRERIYRGIVEPEFEKMLELYGAGKGYGAIRTQLSPTAYREFNEELSKEMISRWQNTGATTTNQAILRMADVLDKAYATMGADAQAAKIIGWKRIPVGRSGYFSRVLNGDRIASLTTAQRRVATQLVSDELQITSGFDRDFSDKLAVKYLERAADLSKGGYMVSLDLRSADTADVVRDALKAMNLDEAEVDNLMGKFARGGARMTKSRLDIDLNAVKVLEDGTEFRLGDLFEQDQLKLFKNYARRMSGEVALTSFGITGAPGAKQLRKAIMSGTGAFNAPTPEIESFDQFISEMLGTPVGDPKRSAFADDLMSVIGSTYLGGMGWTQLAEFANGLHAVGGIGVLKAIGAAPRLYSEVRRIARGEHVDNGLLSSLEVFSGSIGADGYRFHGLRNVVDSADYNAPHDLSGLSLLARGSRQAVRVMSMQRAIEAVQIRGFSEQIVRKAFRFIRDGGEDAALLDMGFTPELNAAIRRNMDRIATFQGGELVGLDLTRMDDALVARTLAATVERGSSQIIQRTYAGEIGKWAHSQQLQLLTQFRSYPIIATQKQWRRVSGSQGTWKAVGYILGSASIVLPIYMARTAIQSVGKDDEWLEKKFSPSEMGLAMARYTSSLGLTSDVINAVGPLFGVESSNRTGAATGAIPAISYLNQMGRAAHAAMDIHSPDYDPLRAGQMAYGLLPGSSYPPAQTLVNWLLADE